MSAISNVGDLIKDMTTAYQQLRDNELALPEAKEIANIAGKIIKAAATKLKYNEYMMIKTPIPFLQTVEASENGGAFRGDDLVLTSRHKKQAV